MVAFCSYLNFALSARHITVHRQSILKASRKSHFISVFQFASESNASCDGSDLDICRQLFLDIIDRGVALDSGVEGKYDLLSILFLYPGYQGPDRQLVRTNTIEW